MLLYYLMHKILLTINVSFCAAFCGFLQKKMYGLKCVTRVMQSSDEQHLACEP